MYMIWTVRLFDRRGREEVAWDRRDGMGWDGAGRGRTGWDAQKEVASRAHHRREIHRFANGQASHVAMSYYR